MKIFLIIVSVVLSGCVAYPVPAYYPAYTVQPDPYQAQALANQECAKSGKVAVMVQQKTCDSGNCATTFECR